MYANDFVKMPLIETVSQKLIQQQVSLNDIKRSFQLTSDLEDKQESLSQKVDEILKKRRVGCKYQKKSLD